MGHSHHYSHEAGFRVRCSCKRATAVVCGSNVLVVLYLLHSLLLPLYLTPSSHSSIVLIRRNGLCSFPSLFVLYPLVFGGSQSQNPNSFPLVICNPFDSLFLLHGGRRSVSWWSFHGEDRRPRGELARYFQETNRRVCEQTLKLCPHTKDLKNWQEDCTTLELKTANWSFLEWFSWISEVILCGVKGMTIQTMLW